MNVYRDDFQFITDEEIKIKDLILSVSCISVQCNIVFRSFINQKKIFKCSYEKYSMLLLDKTNIGF